MGTIFRNRRPSTERTPGGWRRAPRDRRYNLAKYQRVRERVLDRDGHRCFVEGCSNVGDVLDHIEPTTLGTPDALFFDPANMRASCAKHNRARGFATLAAREMAVDEAPVKPEEVRYHHHKYPGGSVALIGDMSRLPHWLGDGCPPECVKGA